MISLYYEAHVTVEPLFGEDFSKFEAICRKHHFRAAGLFMQKRAEDTPERSKNDSFCTGRHRDMAQLENEMKELIAELRANKIKVWRYKMENTIYDSNYADILGAYR